MTVEQLRSLIRDVHDFPKEGIVFKDITPLLADATAFARTVAMMSERLQARDVDRLVAIESRGFIFAAPLAAQLGVPLHLVRKAGKLPHDTVSISYELEYGSDSLEMHADSIDPQVRYAIVDDVIATGGTAKATAELIETHGGNVACFAFVIELAFLGGRERLAGREVDSLIQYT